jgi:uncharacterized membrane protein
LVERLTLLGTPVVAASTITGGVGPGICVCPGTDDDRGTLVVWLAVVSVLLALTLFWALVATFGYERVRQAWDARPDWVDDALDWLSEHATALFRRHRTDPAEAAANAAFRRQTGSARCADGGLGAQSRVENSGPGNRIDGSSSVLIDLGPSNQLPGFGDAAEDTSEAAEVLSEDVRGRRSDVEIVVEEEEGEDLEASKMSEAAAYPRSSTPAPGSAPPTSAPPTSAPPTSAPPTFAPPTSSPTWTPLSKLERRAEKKLLKKIRRDQEKELQLLRQQERKTRKAQKSAVNDTGYRSSRDPDASSTCYTSTLAIRLVIPR